MHKRLKSSYRLKTKLLKDPPLEGLLSLAALIIAVPWMAAAQVSIDSTSITGLIGKQSRIQFDTTGSVTVNLDSAAGNRTWDFTNIQVAGEELTYRFADPQLTPYLDEFPDANFVQQIIQPGPDSVQTYIYLRVAGDTLQTLGTVLASPDTAFTAAADARDLSPLPIDFGMTWSSVQSDTFGNLQASATIESSIAENQVDAWGTMRLPIGDFQCLRIRSTEMNVTHVIVLGTVLSSDSAEVIRYSWISPDNFLVAQAVSQDGETDPNFTNAAEFGMLTSQATGVRERLGDVPLPRGFELLQNYPNPFNPETEIAFQLSSREHTVLAIYNLNGERIRTLVSSALEPGQHVVKWDGRDERGRPLASGAYVYRLQVGEQNKARKMLLLK